MGQVMKGCLPKVFSDPEAARLAQQRQYDLGTPGMPTCMTIRYDLRELIGDGVHGQVWRSVELGGRRKVVAKCYRKSVQSFQFLDVQHNAMEIAELKDCRLRHDNIIAYEGFYESKDLFCTITEYCEGGSVRRALETQLRFTELATAHIFSQCLQAVRHLHSRDIIHRDLRLEQLLLATVPRGRALHKVKVKLGDLMHCTRPKTGYIVTDKAKPVVLLFAAPEVFERQEYSWMSDMWAAGCCMYEMLYGHPPVTGQDRALATRVVQDPINIRPLMTSASALAVHLLKGLLLKEPHYRTPAGQAVKHKWFSQAGKITKEQEEAERKRKDHLDQVLQLLRWATRTLGDTDASHAAGNADELDGQLLEGQAVQGPNPITRTLTGSHSNLSRSTPSSQEEQDVGVEDALASIGLGLPEDTESEDWKVESERSDLNSGPPPSGGDSHSGTYVNSDAEKNPRAGGFWDEFDSAFFEEDLAASSCWSEAEYSDWTATTSERKQCDADFREWRMQRNPRLAIRDREEAQESSHVSTAEVEREGVAGARGGLASKHASSSWARVSASLATTGTSGSH